MFAEPDSSLRGTVTHSSLQAVLAHVETSAWPADIIAMTGDLSQDETESSYLRFKELFSVLALPVYCVPGNHDDRDLMRKLLSTAPFHYCDSVLFGNWHILSIDSCLDGQAGGRVGAAEMVRLEQELENTTAEHILVCLHHPPLSIGSRWLDQVSLHNGDEYFNLLSTSGKVRATIFGHAHQAVDQTRDGIRVIGTPSTCRQFKTASAEFTLDDNPPGYRRIALSWDGAVNSELIWVSDDQEPARQQ